MATATAFASQTWFVRADGGTRYSSNITTGQCNGQYDAPYPGSGVNQNCAFNDVRYLWADGSPTGGTSFPGWGWIGAGGDTYLVDCPTDCRIGWSGPNNTAGPTGYFLGISGDPYSSGAPVPFSGTSGAHTKILGVNYANCASDTNKAHLNGGYGVQNVFNLTGASYVDVACLDITDHSNCAKNAVAPSCASSYPLGDYADNGFRFTNATANVTLTDIRIHGLSSNGMIGALGNGSSMLRVVLAGNGSSGMNFDDGSGNGGKGSLTMSSFQTLWSGCAEEYPIVDALPYQYCSDDGSGGYGDGLGTGDGDVGWLINIDHSTAAYNTQDGFDLLHLRGAGSKLTITDSLMYGNMGQQLKLGQAGIAQNNLIVGNCNALRQAIPGTPSGYNTALSDFCRAADNTVVVSVQDTATTDFEFNTIYSAQIIAVDVICLLGATCTSASTMIYRDNTFVGFLNNTANGYPGGGSGGYSRSVYLDSAPSGLFTNSGSSYDHNATYHGSDPCPNTTFGETSAVCTDPGLVDETWHLYGYGNMTPASESSAVVGAGIAISGITTDYNGVTRPSPPSMGALEYGSGPSGSYTTIQGTGSIQGTAVIQ